MKQITFNFPTSASEIEPFVKKIVLSYDNWATLFFVLTVIELALGQIGDSSQSEQRWTLFWGILLFIWASFLVFTGKSADSVNRRWWLWMVIAFFLPFVAVIAIFVFKTAASKNGS
jgi:hypothetical protein